MTPGGVPAGSTAWRAAWLAFPGSAARSSSGTPLMHEGTRHGVGRWRLQDHRAGGPGHDLRGRGDPRDPARRAGPRERTPDRPGGFRQVGPRGPATPGLVREHRPQTRADRPARQDPHDLPGHRRSVGPGGLARFRAGLKQMAAPNESARDKAATRAGEPRRVSWMLLCMKPASKTIVHADDSASVRRWVAEQLADLDCKVVSVSDGELALKQLRESHCDLL